MTFVKGRKIDPHREYSHKPSHIFYVPFFDAQESDMKVRELSGDIFYGGVILMRKKFSIELENSA